MGAPTMRLAQGYLEFLDIPVLAPGAMWPRYAPANDESRKRIGSIYVQSIL